MNKKLLSSVVLGVAMASSLALATMLTPTVKMIDTRAKIDLATMIPTGFGDWRIDTTLIPLQVNPDLQKNLNELYNQTLSRTYIDQRGERVMLSIAYGGDQTGNLALHKPEQCYTAQGFEVSKVRQTELQTSFGSFPVVRLLAEQGARHEPISYWTTLGDKAIKNGLEHKLLKIRYGLTGRIPDGMLVRVSTLQSDEDASYRVQDQFIQELLSALSATDRERLVGFLGK